MQYRRHEQPGCGGCLLLIIMLVFLTGGAPLIFELLGFLLFGVLFLFLAGIAAFFGFSYFIKRKISEYEKTQTESHNTFVFLLVHILVKIAQLDGTVSKEEINAIQQFFRVNLHYSGDRLYWVKELIREALQSQVNLEALLADFKQKFAYEPRLILLELIYQILYTKTPVPESELKLARDIAGFLDISAYDQRVIESKFKGGGYQGYRATAAPAEHHEAQYYGTLGLEPGADFAEIKSAYRKLSMQYHPDRVAHLGEEFKEVAEKKMKELNVAYEYLEKKFG